MNRNMSSHQFSRRLMLRGLGVTMALPWLESLPVWGDVPGRTEAGERSSGAPGGPVLRQWLSQQGMVGQGRRQADGAWARCSRRSPTSAKRCCSINGLYNEEAQKGNIHSSQTGNLLSGAPLASGGEIRSGTSIDQILAQRYGSSTKVPSLVLGCEKSNPSVHKNYSMLYSSHISWSSPTTPTPLEIYPALAFDRLFKDEASKGDKSVLDAVLADAGSLRSGISSSDQHKLDEYLESVRDVEQRIANAGKKGELQGWRPTLAKPNVARPADGIPQDIAEHMRLMCDILVLGFQTDTTRITTLKLNNDHSSLRFPNLGVDYMIHHLLSHTDTADWLKVNQFFLEQVAYIARKLDAIQEGPRTLLDNTMMLYCSSMLTGNHDARQLPVVMLGGGGGRIKGGRVLTYNEKPDRQMCRLYLSMMDKMQVRMPKFGDASQPLDEV